MSTTPIHGMGAIQLAALIAQRLVSAEEAMDHQIARINVLNPSVNAVVHISESASGDARAVDCALAKGARLGPLAGVPISVKSGIDVAGSPTTAGVRSRRNRIPTVDAPMVARLRAAGAIVLARTNQPDNGRRLHTDSGLYGATLNPWDPTRTPGGSSGGEAVALATGMTHLGIGSDIGGSLRNPATCCGIVSLKPTPGRIPAADEGKTPTLSEQLMAVHGPMARRVEDLRVALAESAGAHVRDPRSILAPGPSLTLPTQRVAIARRGSSSDVNAAIISAAEALESAGYEVEDLEPPHLDEVLDLWHVIAEYGAETGDSTQEDLGAGVLEYAALLNQSPARFPRGPHPLSTALARQNTIASEWASFFAEGRLIVGPVWSTPPWPVGHDISSPMAAMDVLVQAKLTLAANVLGLPAVAVPVLISRGLPIGVQVIGPRFAEERCLDLAQVIEDAMGVPTPIDPRG